MTFLISRGVPSIIFAVLFTGVLLLSLWDLKNWGRKSAYLKLSLFCASNTLKFQKKLIIVRVGAAICGVIVSADNFGNVNVIVAEIILTQIGSFIIYYALVGFYQASYAFLEVN
jgi:hypothetical protein